MAKQNIDKVATPEKEPWLVALTSFLVESGLGPDGIGLFALQLQFDVEDIATVAAEALTGGGNDKKCDMLWVDTTAGLAVIAQCYMSPKTRIAAPSNKASDLNTAASWLLAAPLDDLPNELKGRASELRDAIAEGQIKQLHVWYVHNVPESANCQTELATVAHAVKGMLDNLSPGNTITILHEEVGSGKLSTLYAETERTFTVTDELEFSSPHAFEVQGGNWNSLVATIPGKRLYDLYARYGTDLFSANLRDYLGSKTSDSNINYGIKKTAEQSSRDFWVYNNGITALTMGYVIGKRLRGAYRIKITGISIVNGAQTTGSIGSLVKVPNENLLVPLRLVKTHEKAVIENIVRFNNSQNKVQASDFRSTDSIQTRIRQEFVSVPDAEYDGGRRGGARDAMRRRKNLLPSYTVGQALAAFHGDPVTAYDKKSDIWVNDGTYLHYFNSQTTARHIVLCFGLLEGLHRKYRSLRDVGAANALMPEQDRSQLDFLDKRGAAYLMMCAVSGSLETILGQSIPNKFKLQFRENIAPEFGIALWSPILEVTLPLSRQLDDCFVKNRVVNDKLASTISKFAGLISSLSAAHRPIFAEFRKAISITT